MVQHKNSQSQYDVIIVGGGLAGLTMACLLGQNNVQTAIIDAADPNQPMSGDERTTAISYGSSKILDKAGVWEVLETQGCPIRDIRILDGDSSVLLNFLSEEVADKNFGWVILNSLIRETLREKVTAHKSVSVLAPAKVTQLKQGIDFAAITLEDGSTLTAPLIIGADGRKSFIREQLNIETRGWDYKQSAIVCIASHEHPHNNLAVEHFWPEGPLAILPMNDDAHGNHRSAVVFTEHNAKTKQSWMDINDKNFQLALQARFPENYGQVSIITERTKYPLSLTHASRYIDDRVALIADAAHGIHPIAGQGLNLGFRDVDALCDLIIDAHGNGDDLGSDDLLKGYQRKRRIDNVSMVATTDALVRIFSNDFPPLRIARKIGLRAVSKIPMAKRFFMRQAMADRS